MPGIVGLLTKSPRVHAKQELQRMLNSVRHESSYVAGTWIDESLGVYIGWTGRQDSSASSMPLKSELGDAILVFSGEEFSEDEIVPQLREKGRAAQTDGTSYLLHFCEEDPAFYKRLNGRFHGALINRSRGTFTIFNDRYGIHRLYFHESQDTFYFSVEAKAILAVRPELRSIDSRSLGEFVSCSCVLENRTLFKNVSVLPPASAWTFRNDTIEEKATYFHPREWENQESLSPEDYYQALRTTFTRVLPRYFKGKERIGISLTGGLDTRMIMAWQKIPANSHPCYSFGSMFRETEDVKLARRVAQVCNQTFEVVEVGKEFLSDFHRYAERAVFLTDGCTGVKSSADLFVNERAAQIAPVRITGNYGGEILRQLRAFKPSEPAAGLFCPDFLPSLRNAQKTYDSYLKGHALTFTAFHQTPWYHFGLLALEEAQLSLRSPYLDNDLVRIAYRSQASARGQGGIFEDSADSVRLIREGNPTLAQIRTDRGLAGNSTTFLASATRSALELTFKAEYAYDYGMPQWLAGFDHAFSMLHLERLFLGRHKFNHYRVWYRDALADYIRQMLLDSRTLNRPYVVRSHVEEMVSSHLKGTKNYTTEIHLLLTLELIHRLFVDASN